MSGWNYLKAALPAQLRIHLAAEKEFWNFR
jgi:hypothetical protein